MNKLKIIKVVFDYSNGLEKLVGIGLLIGILGFSCRILFLPLTYEGWKNRKKIKRNLYAQSRADGLKIHWDKSDW